MTQPRTRPFTVGISAVFNPDVTAHARTFLRALATARNHIPGLGAVRFVYADDAASPDIARTVAAGFVAQRVDLVIGHFSSDAALAAIETYAGAETALLTPAATADAVTGNGTAFRLCPKDARLARSLIDLGIRNGWQALNVRCDDSAHGRAIAQGVCDVAAASGMSIVPVTARADAVVFAGRLGASNAFVRQHVSTRPTVPLVLTDDAVSPWLTGQGGLQAPVLAVGFQPAQSYPRATTVLSQHQLLFCTLPETYFLESYLAFEILAALQARLGPAPGPARVRHALAEGSFETVAGTIRFVDGEGSSAGHSLWSLGAAGLEPLNETAAARIGASPVPCLAPTTLCPRADQRIPS